MLRYVLRLPEDKFDSLDYPSKLATYERKLMGEVCDILIPLKMRLIGFRGDNIVISTRAIISTRGVHEKFRSLRDTYNCKMVSTTPQKSIETPSKNTPNVTSWKLPQQLTHDSSWHDVVVMKKNKKLKTLIYRHMPVAETTEATPQPSSKHTRLMGLLRETSFS